MSGHNRYSAARPYSWVSSLTYMVVVSIRLDIQWHILSLKHHHWDCFLRCGVIICADEHRIKLDRTRSHEDTSIWKQACSGMIQPGNCSIRKACGESLTVGSRCHVYPRCQH